MFEPLYDYDLSRLRAELKRLKITYSMCARAFGMPPSTFQALISGRNTSPLLVPAVESLLRLFKNAPAAVRSLGLKRGRKVTNCTKNKQAKKIS